MNTKDVKSVGGTKTKSIKNIIRRKEKNIFFYVPTIDGYVKSLGYVEIATRNLTGQITPHVKNVQLKDKLKAQKGKQIQD